VWSQQLGSREKGTPESQVNEIAGESPRSFNETANARCLQMEKGRGKRETGHVSAKSVAESVFGAAACQRFCF
jgi:hypothetical protein